MTPEELLEIKKRLGFESRLALARAVGVTKQTVANWENGDVPIPQTVINLLRCWESLNRKIFS